MSQYTVFSWGYYGWGKSAAKFVELVDALEQARGFRPPVFVDVRINRAVRARDFVGGRFAELVGLDRYTWLKGLGNASVESGRGPAIRIKSPRDADKLLDAVVTASRDRRRVIFFCGCQSPRLEGRINCHRVTIGNLLLRAARRRCLKLDLVEWPGGKPGRIDLSALPREVDAARNDDWVELELTRGSLRRTMKDFDGVPWGSLIRLSARSGETTLRLGGPLRWRRKRWMIPLLPSEDDGRLDKSHYFEAHRYREEHGLNARSEPPSGPVWPGSGKRCRFEGKGLTLIQPWASAIAFGGKDVENRGWQTHYRGPIAIHAGSKYNVDGLDDPIRRRGEPTRTVGELIDRGRNAFGLGREAEELVRGHIIAIGMIVGCERPCKSPWYYEGEWGWHVAGVIPIKPVPWEGGLSLWDCAFEYEPLAPRGE